MQKKIVILAPLEYLICLTESFHRMKRIFFAVLVFILSADATFGQQQMSESKAEKDSSINKNISSNPLRFSGYIQTQYQYGERYATLKVGGSNTDNNKNFNRIGIRRGRIKMQYEKGIVEGVFQVDVTEKGFRIKDVYISLKDPWKGIFSLNAGIFNLPFGYEVSYSSSRRASPERAKVITTLFPDERDIGAMLTLEGPDSSMWKNFKLELGVIGGNATNMELDNHKDFIAHLTYHNQLSSKLDLGGGFSYYSGGVYQGNANVYSMENNSFILNSNIKNVGDYALRRYFGADLQVLFKTNWGASQIYGEYIFGSQPGGINSTESPDYTSLPDEDTYIRNFTGGYITFVQELGGSNVSFIAKYDCYDPNIKVEKNELGSGGTTKADVAYKTFGSGLLWQLKNGLRLTGYYDWILNEKSANLTGYEKDISDNVFTLRLQYKF